MDLIKRFEREGVEIDDIRWYLARKEAERLLTYRDDVESLVRLIHSGRLEADWYRMEERFLETLEEQLGRKVVDESEIDKIIGEVGEARAQRGV